MKPILYSPKETAFDTNGIGILTDAVECRVVAELNGQYELTLRYPITGVHYKDLVRRAIILAKPDPVSDPQPFRIYRRVPSSQGTITVYARHIAYDLKGNVVSPFSATGAAAALQALKANSANPCAFTFWTDKSAASTMTVATPAAIWSLLGGSAGSVLNVFGGEYEFDRFTVKLWNHRGADRGVSIRYGKNLTSLKQDENISNTYTGVYPYWQDTEGNLVQLPEKIVNVPGTFDHVRIMPLDLSTEWQEAPSEAQLRARAAKYIADNDIGTPPVSWTVKHVDLAQTEEYKGKTILELLLMGDTVAVEFADMDVSASSRVVATDFDVLAEIYNSTTLGSVRANVADTIVQQGQQIQDAKKEVFHYVAAENKKLDQVELLKRLTKEWVDDGIYLTEEGKLGIRASAIVTGLLSSADQKTFYLDLDSGILRMNATEFSVAGKAVDTIAQEKVNGMSQAEVFNKLTNNGSLPGLFMQGGQLCINASYIRGGTVSADYIDVANLKVNATQITSGTIDSARIPNLSADKITSGTLDSARINGATLNITKGATIAGWNIDENSIFSNSGTWYSGTFMCTGSSGYYSIGGSGSLNNWVFGAGGKFGVRKNGNVWCSDIHATGGSIGGWTIEGSRLSGTQGGYTIAISPIGVSGYYTRANGSKTAVTVTWDAILTAAMRWNE